MAERPRAHRLYGRFAQGGLVSDSSSASVSANEAAVGVRALSSGGAGSAAPASVVMPAAAASAKAAAPAAPSVSEPRAGTEGVEPSGHESSGNTSEGLGGEAVQGNPGGASVNYNKGGPVKHVAGKPIGKDDGVIAAQRGEFVVRKSAVQKLGAAALDEINKGRLPHGLYGRKAVRRVA